MDLNEDEQQTSMLNGRCVMTALTSLNNKGTKNQLLRHFMKQNDQPRKLVEDELNRILDNGVTEGFIMKSGNNYLLPNQWNEYQIDCDEGGRESSEAKKKYVDAYKDLGQAATDLQYAEVLINNVIDYVSEEVEANKEKNIISFETVFSIKARILREKVLQFYRNTHDFFTSEIPRRRILDDFRQNISDQWNQSGIKSDMLLLKKNFEEALNAVKYLGDGDIRTVFLNYVIRKVKTADKPELGVNVYHYDKGFSKKLSGFCISAQVVYNLDKNYNFSNCYTGVTDDTDKESEIVETVETVTLHTRMADPGSTDTDTDTTPSAGAACSGLSPTRTTVPESAVPLDPRTDTDTDTDTTPSAGAACSGLSPTRTTVPESAVPLDPRTDTDTDTDTDSAVFSFGDRKSSSSDSGTDTDTTPVAFSFGDRKSSCSDSGADSDSTDTDTTPSAGAACSGSGTEVSKSVPVLGASETTGRFHKCTGTTPKRPLDKESGEESTHPSPKIPKKSPRAGRGERGLRRGRGRGG